MIKKYTYLSGVTLVELIIVVAIIGILSAVILVSSSGYRTQRVLERASHEVAGALREAQNYALSGRADSINESTCWYAVLIAGTGTQYTVVNQYRLSSSGSGVCGTNKTVSTYTLGGGAQFTGSNQIGFTLPRAEPIYSTGSNMVSLVSARSIAVSFGGMTYYICIYPTGRVVENRGNATCS